MKYTVTELATSVTDVRSDSLNSGSIGATSPPASGPIVAPAYTAPSRILLTSAMP
ncbi:hypothetical protein GCM10018954_062070 [Kutzneria kofuensis]